MSADLVLMDGRVYTLDARSPWVESVAISNGRIVAIGSMVDISAHIGTNTEILQLEGQFVLPGFIDSHLHFEKGSRNLPGVRFRGIRKFSDVLDKIKTYASENPNSPWILGSELGIGYPDSDSGFVKSYLDKIVPDRPVFLRSGMGHADWVNSKTLELACITRDTPDPKNGKIERDAVGEPTGWLVEEARRLIEPLVPALSDDETLTCLRQGLVEANRFGITGAQSAGHDDAILPLLMHLRNQGELSVRFSIAQIIQPPALSNERITEISNIKDQYHGEFLSVDTVKFFIDGVIESHTGSMPDGYADCPDSTGLKRWNDGALFQAFRLAHHHGFQNWCHATGPGGVTQALDGFERDARNTRRLRPRIEHAEIPDPRDIQRMSNLGVVAGIQPAMIYPKDQCPGMEGVWQKRVGEHRMSQAFPIRDILIAGGRVAFGTDWPITDLNPLVGIRNAILRRSQDGEPSGGWVPEQSVSVAQAIHAYTLGAAYGARREEMEGSISPGKHADLIILSENLFEIDPHKISSVDVLMTMIGGRIVHRVEAL